MGLVRPRVSISSQARPDILGGNPRDLARALVHVATLTRIAAFT
jgi:hypothetical protein